MTWMFWPVMLGTRVTQLKCVKIILLNLGPNVCNLDDFKNTHFITNKGDLIS